MVAQTLLSTIILFFLCNIVLHVIFSIKDHFSPSNNVHYMARTYDVTTSELKAVYPDISEKEINELLKETGSLRMEFYPDGLYREQAFDGKFVNVAKAGYRVSRNQAPWPPLKSDLTVFVFGGSTTFGYGIADDDTIPSFLTEHLRDIGSGRRIAVYNFGVGASFSTLEKMKYLGMLSKGIVPDMAIFIDGLNDFFYQTNDLPIAKKIFRLVEENFYRQWPQVEFLTAARLALRDITYSLPMYRLYRVIDYRLTLLRSLVEDYENPYERINEPVDRKIVDFAIERYMRNKDIISGASKPFGIKTFFVWQPSPLYKFDLTKHILYGNKLQKRFLGNQFNSQSGYPVVAKKYENGDFGNNFIWCAGVQAGPSEASYVDAVHYTRKFSELISKCIASSISNISQH
jgi:hypothetical protein